MEEGNLGSDIIELLVLSIDLSAHSARNGVEISDEIA